MFFFILPGCKGHSPITPIIPPEDSKSEKDISDDWQKRMSSGPGSNVRLIITGPPEYLTSELKPKLITESQPVFSATLINSKDIPESDDFKARIDNESIKCIFDPSTNEVRFTPDSPLGRGNHIAALYFRNSDGSSGTLWWTLKIETEPPGISALMRSIEGDYFVIFFDRAVEPSYLLDSSRWMINDAGDIFRTEIDTQLGGLTVFLPMKKNIFGLFDAEQPLTLSFVDKNGKVDYVITRGGSSRQVQYDPPPCNCNNVSIQFFPQDHHTKETEDYKFGYIVSNPGNCIVMEWEGWQLCPIINDNPEDNFDQDFDMNSGPDNCQSAPPGVPHPILQSLTVQNGIHTITLTREYSHNFNVSFWADCNPGRRANGSRFETRIATKSYTFNSGFDITPPVFDSDPEVLYGDEAADRITEMTNGILWADDGINGEVRCINAVYDDPGNGGFVQWMEQLRTNDACDLFIVVKASDPITGDRYGRLGPSQICLDFKRFDGINEYYEFGDTWVSGPAGCGMVVLDHRPFAGMYQLGDPIPPPGTSNPHELDFLWPDRNEEGMRTVGGLKEDWSGDEISIIWINLTNILANAGDEIIKEIKVRIADDAPEPYGDYHGNWRRSDDVMEQLCEDQERGGSIYRSGASVRPGVHLSVEPGIPPDNQDDPELYWIDGPAIRITDEGGDEAPNPPEVTDCLDDWDLYSLQHKWLPFRNPNPKCGIGSYVPSWDAMKISQIRMRVCIDCICDIVAFRIYAVNETTRRRYDIREPLTNSIYFTDIDRYRGNCFLHPLKCLDPDFIVWNISDIPCGEYKIHVECYDEIVYENADCLPDPEKFLKALVRDVSPKLKLDVVVQSDVVRIAPIYDGDDYKEGGSYRPRNNHDENNNDTVDCCNYVTQLLRRLARTEFGAYPIRHTDATAWRFGRSDQVEVIQFGELEAGDIIVWRDTSHVGMFDCWAEENEEHQPENGVYYAWIWESRHCDGVGRNLHKLGISSSNRGSDYHWHGARQWIEDIVFSVCPAQ